VTGIASLARALMTAGVPAEDLDAEVLRDAVWMAVLVGAEADAAPERTPETAVLTGVAENAAPERTPEIRKQTSGSPPAIDREALKSPEPVQTGRRAGRGWAEPPGGVFTATAATGDFTAPAAAARLPAPSPLPEALAIARALHPFRRARRPGRRDVFDVEATIHATVEAGGPLQPVMRRVSEPRFAAHLVVDNAAVMGVWAKPLRTVFDAVRRANVFSSVERWTLDPVDGEPAVSSALDRRHRPIHPPWMVANRDDVVLLATNAQAENWRRDSWWNIVSTWGEHACLALLNPLPPRWWGRTALPAHTVRVRAEPRAGTNLALRARRPRRMRSAVPDSALPLPVLALRATDMLAWSATVAGAHPDGCPGVLMAGTALSAPQRPAAGVEAVSGFRRLGSARAWRLAVLLSASDEHSFETMRIVQDLLPDSSTADLAQVLASGLMHEYMPSIFRFDRAARQALHAELLADDAYQVFRCLQTGFERSAGTNTFGVLLKNPDSIERLSPRSSALGVASMSALRACGYSQKGNRAGHGPARRKIRQVFLSYSDEDHEVARRLASCLLDQGIEPVDPRDEKTRAAAMGIGWTERWIGEADLFFVLLSPRFLASPWCRRELDLAFRVEQDARNQFIHVAKVSEMRGADPGFLCSYDWLDLAPPVDDEKLRRITQALALDMPPRPDPAQPDARLPVASAARSELDAPSRPDPAQPDARLPVASAARSELDAPSRPDPPQPTTEPPVETAARSPNARPTVFRAPTRDPNFTGRDGELGRIRASLVAGKGLAVQVLHGRAGVGKTQTVIEYAHRHARDYDVVWWINAKPPTLIPDQIAALAEPLGLPGELRPDDAARAVRTELAARSGWLLIFDDAESPDDLRRVLPSGDGHVLITTRRNGFDSLGPVRDLDVLPREDAIALLQRRLPTMTTADAGRLADLLGRLPSALNQTASYLDPT
jgi:TIR domain